MAVQRARVLHRRDRARAARCCGRWRAAGGRRCSRRAGRSSWSAARRGVDVLPAQSEIRFPFLDLAGAVRPRRRRSAGTAAARACAARHRAAALVAARRSRWPPRRAHELAPARRSGSTRPPEWRRGTPSTSTRSRSTPRGWSRWSRSPPPPTSSSGASSRSPRARAGRLLAPARAQLVLRLHRPRLRVPRGRDLPLPRTDGLGAAGNAVVQLASSRCCRDGPPPRAVPLDPALTSASRRLHSSAWIRTRDLTIMSRAL